LIGVRSKGRSGVGRVVPLRRNGIDWLVCLLVPEQDYRGPSDRLLLGFAVLGTLFLGLITLRLTRLAGRIGRPLAQLAESAEDLGQGGAPRELNSQIDEVRILSRALQRAGESLQSQAALQRQLEHVQRLESVGTLAGASPMT